MYFEVFETTGDMIWPSFYKQKDKKNIELKNRLKVNAITSSKLGFFCSEACHTLFSIRMT